MHGALKNYKLKKEPYIGKRNKLSINAKNFYDGIEIIIDAFNYEIFPMTPNSFSEDEEPPRDEETLKKIAAVDDILEPGLVKKYF